jgi:hypothetical protein
MKLLEQAPENTVWTSEHYTERMVDKNSSVPITRL